MCDDCDLRSEALEIAARKVEGSDDWEVLQALVPLLVERWEQSSGCTDRP